MKPDEAYGLIFSWDNVVVIVLTPIFMFCKLVSGSELRQLSSPGGVYEGLSYKSIGFQFVQMILSAPYLFGKSQKL